MRGHLSRTSNANRKSQIGFPRQRSIASPHSTFISNMSMRPLRRSVWSDVVGRATKIQAFAFAGLICVLCQCTRHYDQKEAERYIVESERQWAKSVARTLANRCRRGSD